MNIKDLERAFSDSELVQGAEICLSNDLTGTTFIKRTNLPSGTSLSGSVTEWSPAGKKVVRKCRMDYLESRGIVLNTFCPCEEFAADGYGCRHVAALLTAYLISLRGNDILRGTRLEQQLKAVTMVEDPFTPGAIRRTDDRLAGLMRGFREDNALPVWNEEAAHNEQTLLHSACSVLVSGDSVYLEMKLGAGRLYVMKDLPALLNAYQSGSTFPFGQNEYPVSRSSCDEKTAALLDLLLAEKNALPKNQQGLFAGSSQNILRYMLLRDRWLDRFMELRDGENLDTTFGTFYVDLDHKGLKATLRKKTYGASLKIDSRRLLFADSDFFYLLDGNIAFRIPTGPAGSGKQFLTLLSLEDSLYIRESDIPGVYRNILPVFEEHGQVILRGMDPEDYEKEKPAFRFELDYAKDQELLTCRAVSVYPSVEKEYSLFASSEDSARRNGAEETRVAEIIRPIFRSFDPASGILSRDMNEPELFAFLRDRLPELEKQGTVVGTDAFRRLRIRRLPTLSVGISIRKGDLMMSLSGNGMSREEVDEILSAYSRKKNYFRLKSGAFVALDEENPQTWDTCAELYQHYGKKNPEAMKLPMFRALYLREMLENRDDALLTADKGFLSLCQKMDPEKRKAAAVPESLADILRPYQVEGFRWISTLKDCGFGGILADDMGLGKTLQVIAFLLSEKLAGKKGDALRTLVVCPASLVYNWQKEIERFAPELTSVCIAGNAPARAKTIGEAADTDIWITSYDLLKRDIALYEDIVFASEIIDEAQFIKNQTTQAAQSVRIVKSSFRVALTGTPIENHLSELWSIMDYLMPGFLYSYTGFQKDFEAPIAVSGDTEALDRLRRMTHPFILRRLKKQVLKELPDKLEETVTVRMDGEQRQLYDALSNEIRISLQHTSDSDFRTGKLQFLSQLTKLREVCCDPSLLYENYRGGSPKLDACIQLTEEAIAGGHKLLLFSQFTSMLDRIGARLNAAGIAYHRIDGSVSKERRMEMVEAFANDDVPVFCVSLKAGSTGLNLTAADIVIHYDPWWNKAAQDQATDRAHRIGQNHVVTVYELIAEDSVEEHIQNVKDGKKKLADDVLSGESIESVSLSREDLLSLLDSK